MNYDPETYWEERYGHFRLASSGHRDLPEAYNYWLYERKKTRIREGLQRERISVPSCNILELGCGTGVYVDMWKSLGAESLTGFDITSTSVGNLAPKYPGIVSTKRTSPIARWRRGTAAPSIWSRPSTFCT